MRACCETRRAAASAFAFPSLCLVFVSFQAADLIHKLYDIFIKYDATLIEINPMAEDATGVGL